MATHINRETWLKAATELLDKEFFTGRGHKLPEKLLASCGFPYKSAKAIGQCWSPDVTDDATHHIFICPSLGDPMLVLATHLHELIHACVGIKEGHKGRFAELARGFGLKGRLTATYAEEGSELWHKLAMFAAELGPYPHSPMQKKAMARPRGTAQGGWVRFKSPEQPKYRVLVSPKMLEEFGAPLDPWGNQMEEITPEAK